MAKHMLESGAALIQDSDIRVSVAALDHVSNIDNNTVTIDALDTPGPQQLVPISRLEPFIPCPARDTFITEAGGSHGQQMDATQQH
uniref:Uncharacterized protein n=1 Tax=Romanomermis culicivorax TaxID=13658 RepID=A0A915I7Y1_ROMCU